MGSVNLDNTGSGSAITLSSDGTDLLLDGTAIGGGGIAAVVDDTTPQLGGNLDVNAKAINFGDSNGTTTNMLTFGVGSDLKIYHDSATNKSHIKETGTSHLQIQGQEIQFLNDAGTSLMTLSPSQVEILHAGSKKLETYTGGIQTTGTVNVNGAYTLPTADGTANQVLTTDGSGAVTFATAGGGSPDLFAENPVSAVTPIATGNNSISIGSNSQAASTNGNSIAIGTTARATGNSSAAFGGNFPNASAAGSLALGYNPTASGAFSAAIGYDAKAVGGNSVAFTKSYASGTDSFAAAIAYNTSSYGASGSGAVALMNYAKATGSSSGAFGFGANATNWGAHALGAQTFATGDSSVSLGRNSLASATYSICIGNAGQNNIQSSIKFSGSQHANQGDAQIGLYPLMADTTDATATAMVTNHQSTPGAGTANQIVLPNNSAYAFHGTIVARQKAGDGTACAAWKVEGLIRREGSASATVLVNSATTVLDNTPNWGMALSADTTNGGLKVQVTGAASTNIRWTTSITTSELTYA